jgi:maleylpyruvate isomerase
MFLRRLNELTDAQLLEPAHSVPWNRAHVVADIAYHARALCGQIEAVAAGSPTPPTYESPDERKDAVMLGGTLPPRALRHLFEHAAIHLDVVWRDLPGPLWATEAPDEQGNSRSLSRTAFDRAVVLWLGAIELGNGSRWSDLPQNLREAVDNGYLRRNVTASPFTSQQTRTTQ